MINNNNLFAYDHNNLVGINHSIQQLINNSSSSNIINSNNDYIPENHNNSNTTGSNIQNDTNNRTNLAIVNQINQMMMMNNRNVTSTNMTATTNTTTIPTAFRNDSKTATTSATTPTTTAIINETNDSYDKSNANIHNNNKMNQELRQSSVQPHHPSYISCHHHSTKRLITITKKDGPLGIAIVAYGLASQVISIEANSIGKNAGIHLGDMLYYHREPYEPIHPLLFWKEYENNMLNTFYVVNVPMKQHNSNSNASSTTTILYQPQPSLLAQQQGNGTMPPNGTHIKRKRNRKDDDDEDIRSTNPIHHGDDDANNWKHDELERLKYGMKMYGANEISKLVEVVGTRTATQIKDLFNTHKSGTTNYNLFDDNDDNNKDSTHPPTIPVGGGGPRWHEDEIQRLNDAIRIYGRKNVIEISKAVGTRTMIEVRSLFYHLSKKTVSYQVLDNDLPLHQKNKNSNKNKKKKNSNNSNSNDQDDNNNNSNNNKNNNATNATTTYPLLSGQEGMDHNDCGTVNATTGAANTTNNNSYSQGAWSQDEKDRLKIGIEKYDKCYKAISLTVNTRNVDQVKRRCYQEKKANNKRTSSTNQPNGDHLQHKKMGIWSEDEVMRLKEAIRIYGTKDYNLLVEFVGTRTAKQIMDFKCKNKKRKSGNQVILDQEELLLQNENDKHSNNSSQYDDDHHDSDERKYDEDDGDDIYDTDNEKDDLSNGNTANHTNQEENAKTTIKRTTRNANINNCKNNNDNSNDNTIGDDDENDNDDSNNHNGHNKGVWQDDEIERLIEAVKLIGSKKTKRLAEVVGTRTTKQVCEFFRNIRKGGTKQQWLFDRLLLEEGNYSTDNINNGSSKSNESLSSKKRRTDVTKTESSFL